MYNFSFQLITIKKNIDLKEECQNYDVLLVGTNLYGRLTNGWQLDAKLLYPIIHKINLETRYGDIEKLGKVIKIEQKDKPTVCLLYITKGYNFRPDLQKDYLEYDALERCLRYINIVFKGKNIACPILGYSKFEGNGNKEKIIKLFENILTDVNVTLYDYEQISSNERDLNIIKKIMDAKMAFKVTKDKSEYYRLIKEKKEYKERLKKINNLKIDF